MCILLALTFCLASTALVTPTRPWQEPPRPYHNTPHPRPIQSYSAQEIITKLSLTSNPEDGYFTQNFEDPVTYNNRSVSTAIYYLLEGSTGQSLWHKVDAPEVWHWYAGAPLTLSLSWNDGSVTREECLGTELFEGQRPQVVVQREEWQSARSEGEWTLVGTTGKCFAT